MKNDQIVIGAHYVIRLNNRLTTVLIQSYGPVEGWRVYSGHYGKALYIKAACHFLRIATGSERIQGLYGNIPEDPMSGPVMDKHTKCRNFQVQYGAVAGQREL